MFLNDDSQKREKNDNFIYNKANRSDCGDNSIFVTFDESQEFSKSQLDFMDFLNKVIKVLVHKRVSLKMTQSDLADKVGISKVSVCRIETRAKTPSLETLFKMATCLDVGFNDFVDM